MVVVGEGILENSKPLKDLATSIEHGGKQVN